MSLKSLMSYTFVSKYARWDSKKLRRETWGESVDRVRQMMIDKYADPADPNIITDSKEHIEIVKLIDQAYSDMKKKRSLIAKALQFGGSPVFKHNARIYNCIASYSDRVRFFQECMYLLLCDAVLDSLYKHHIAKLPNLIKENSQKKYVIKDSIEGWSDAVGILVSSY